jgi:DNA-binding transcriptional regulator YiaG
MAKPLSSLVQQVSPEIVEAAKARAEQEVFEWRLARLREQLELSQVQLAGLMDVSQPSVANLEKRGTEIKLSSLKRYIEAMGGKLTIDIELPDGRHIGMSC